MDDDKKYDVQITLQISARSLVGALSLLNVTAENILNGDLAGIIGGSMGISSFSVDKINMKEKHEAVHGEGLKAAKASPEDVNEMRQFLFELEEMIKDHEIDASQIGEFCDSKFDILCGRNFQRILFGYETLIENACDPSLPYLEFKPELKDPVKNNPKINQLALFALKILEEFPDLSDLDGFEIQDLAEKYGLLIPEIKHEPCSDELCSCRELYSAEEFKEGVRCFHIADWLLTAEE